MKALVVVAILGLVAWLYGQQVTTSRRAEKIAQHQFALAWPMKDVRASLGEPAAVQAKPAGAQTWIYPTGQTVTFSKAGYVIESGSVDPRSIRLPSTAANTSPVRQSTYLPQLNRYVEHDTNVSATTSAGLNAYTGVGGRAPGAASATPNRGSTALNPPPRR